MSDYITGKTRKQLKTLEADQEALKRVLKNREEDIALKQWSPKIDSESLFDTKPGFKNMHKIKSVNNLNKRINEIFAEKLSKSLALVVANAVRFDEGSENAKVAIVNGVSDMYQKLFATGKIDLSKLSFQEAPHTVEYLNNLKALAIEQANVELNEKPENKDTEDTFNSEITQYETELSSVVNEKIKLMIKNEKEIQARRDADMLYAKENAMDAEKYMKKKEKTYGSMFKEIMNAHVESAMNAGKEINKTQLMAESIISYAVLEALHTSKLATRADLSYIE